MNVGRRAIEGYVKKFSSLVECGALGVDVYQKDIERSDIENCSLWLDGAYSGMLIYFLQSLTEDEKTISDEVFNEIKRSNEGLEDVRIGLKGYIEAAVIVLEKLGFHIPD